MLPCCQTDKVRFMPPNADNCVHKAELAERVSAPIKSTIPDECGSPQCIRCKTYQNRNLMLFRSLKSTRNRVRILHDLSHREIEMCGDGFNEFFIMSLIFVFVVFNTDLD